MNETKEPESPQSPIPPPQFTNVQEAFADYARRAIPDLLSAKIVRAIQAGFYAGAQTTLVLIQDKSRAIDNTDFSDDDYAAAISGILDSINDEVLSYFKFIEQDLREQGRIRGPR